MEEVDFTTTLAKKSDDLAGSEKTVFKQPVIVGKRPGAKSNKTTQEKREVVTENERNHEETDSDSGEEEKPGDNGNKTDPVFAPPPKVPEKKLSAHPQKSVEVNYRAPSWSGNCERDFYLEILKNGTIVEITDLTTKPYFLFGRLPGNNVVLEHPSISRYHALLQYRSVAEEGQDVGWYLYDLDSTHGTFLNKQRLPPREYTRIRAGHVFKLGASTRLFILQGPEEDQEKESDLTVTELKELRRKHEALMEQEDNKELEKPPASTQESSQNSGINWGMGEDAEEENPNAENPFAIIDEPAANEDLYLDDPKKALKNWFEREGYDLDYQVEEKSYAFFVCRVELPIDTANGAPVIAEASVRGGKKKEAIVQCAMEACRILDQHGLLRQSKHESKKRRRERNEDYYSSDEDSFLDRTGAAERKRLSRTKGKVSDEAETYESLNAKYEALKKEIEAVERSLTEVSKKSSKKADEDVDDIDDYINSLKAEETAPKKSAAVLRVKLGQLQKEEKRLLSLIKVAKPHLLPTLPPMPMMEYKEVSLEEETKASALLSERSEKPEKPVQSPHESKRPKIETKSKNSAAPRDETKEDGKKSLTSDIISPLKPTNEAKVTKPAEAATESPKKEAPKPKSTKESVYVLEGREEEESKGGLVVRKKKARGMEKPKKIETPQWAQHEAEDSSKYDMWVPPSDQSGDGKTSLNKKLGY